MGLLGITCDVQRVGQRPVDLLRRVQRLQCCHRSFLVEIVGSTVRARSSEAIDPLKKFAMVETSAEFYEGDTLLGVAKIGSRSPASSSAKAS